MSPGRSQRGGSPHGAAAQYGAPGPRGAVGPPAEFRAFAERQSGPLRGALWVGSDADRVLTELLSEVAARWLWLGWLGSGLRRIERAERVLDRLASRAAVRPGPHAIEVRLGDQAPSRDLAAIAWANGRRARRRRLCRAAATAIAVVVLVTAFPYARKQPPGPPAGELRSSSPLPMIDLMPPPWSQTRLPVRATPLPRSVNLTPVGGIKRLAERPVRRALALFLRDPATLLVLGEDGELRRLDGLQLPDVRLPTGEARPALVPTSLSPEGTSAAFLGNGSVTVVEIGTGTVRSYRTDGPTTALVWLSPGTLLISGPASAATLDLMTGALARQPYEPEAPLAIQDRVGPSGGEDVFELRFAGQPVTSPAQVRHWRGGRPDETFLGADQGSDGLSLDWLGAWQGPGWLIGANAVRDGYATDLWLPPPKGPVRFATVFVNVSTGAAGRALIRTGDSGALSPPTVLGWLDPTTVLVQAGDVDSPNLLAWRVTDGRLSLVASISGSAGISVADLASWR